MDNYQFDVTAERDAVLEHALQIAFGRYSTATGWRTDERDGKPRLLFTWLRAPVEGSGWTPFVTPIAAEQALAVVKGWLNCANYGREPDHDGDNHKGWRVYCDSWGHVDPYGHAGLCAIEPAWAMYGK